MLCGSRANRDAGCVTERRGAVTSGQQIQGVALWPFPRRVARALGRLPLLRVLDGLSLSIGIVNAPGALAVRPVQSPA
jgi:hypothetical protein